MSIDDHGCYGNQNRKFLAGIYKPKPSEVFMKISAPSNISLPAKCDLRLLSGNIEVYNQGSIGSCTANAIAGAYKIMALINLRRDVSISRLFLYYNERQMIGQVNEDSGAFIKDGFMSMYQVGSCLEIYWPYVESWFKNQPSFPCYREAKNHCTMGPHTQLNPMDMVQSIKLCLSMNKPVVIGIMVYESFQSEEAARTGLIPYPNVHSEKFVGGHALTCVGYDDSINHFIVLNSWGSSWGKNGYCLIPYAFISNNDLCNDCHAFDQVEVSLMRDSVPPYSDSCAAI